MGDVQQIKFKQYILNDGSVIDLPFDLTHRQVYSRIYYRNKKIANLEIKQKNIYNKVNDLQKIQKQSESMTCSGKIEYEFQGAMKKLRNITIELPLIQPVHFQVEREQKEYIIQQEEIIEEKVINDNQEEEILLTIPQMHNSISREIFKGISKKRNINKIKKLAFAIVHCKQTESILELNNLYNEFMRLINL